MKFYYILLILISSFELKANNIINSSELLNILRQDTNVYISLHKLQLQDKFYSLNFKDLQENEEVKNYLLKLLDVNEYVKYRINDFNTYQKKGELDNFLLQRYNNSYVDTIYKEPSLLKFFSDSVVYLASQKYHNQFYNDENSMSSEIEFIFSGLKYPEVYEKTLENLKLNLNSQHFRKLLRLMQDSIEWNNFKKDIANQINQKKLLEDRIVKETRSLFYPGKYGSLSVDFFISMLTINKASYYRTNCLHYSFKEVPYNITVLCDDDCCISRFLFKSDDPIIKIIFKRLLGDCKYMPACCINNSPLCKMTYAELEEISDYIIKNKEHFIKALEPLKEKYDKENEWWRSKITYRK